MLPFAPLFANPVVQSVLWSAATIGFYFLTKRLYRRWHRWWLMPLAAAPALLILLVLGLHESYRDYIRGTGWLVAMLGPTMVAFAVPIYENQALIRRHWPVLVIGVAVGTTTAFLTGWGFSTLLGLNGVLRLSLLPRSMSTPFAMQVSGDIGGVPDLTAVFVIVTGIFGALIGKTLLAWLPVRSSLARGALFGLGAHGAGAAKALEIGSEEGSIAGLIMVLAGLANVLLAPLLSMVMRAAL
jgi:predicted murein hydrolase (TIGR00659 family)